MRLLTLFTLAFFASLSIGTAEETKVLGYLEGFHEIEMAPAESGNVADIFVEEGERVEKGKELIKLDCRVEEANLDVAKLRAKSTGAVDAAKADMDFKLTFYNKVKNLGGSTSRREKDKAKAEYDMAKANHDIASEEKEINSLRVDEITSKIERRILRAPVDGVVTEIKVDTAESVSPANPILTLMHLDRLKLVVYVPLQFGLTLKKGDILPVELADTNVVTSTEKPEAVTGEIEFVSPVINPASQTVRTRLVVDNKDGKLRAGSHCFVILGRKADASTATDTPSSDSGTEEK